MGDLSYILIIPIGIALYLIPSMIGWNKRNADGIVAVNVLLGWTFIGWIGSLIWALSDSQKAQQQSRTIYQKSNAEKLKTLKELLDSGALTVDEFNKEKQKIINQ